MAFLGLQDIKNINFDMHETISFSCFQTFEISSVKYEIEPVNNWITQFLSKVKMFHYVINILPIL